MRGMAQVSLSSYNNKTKSYYFYKNDVRDKYKLSPIDINCDRVTRVLSGLFVIFTVTCIYQAKYVEQINCNNNINIVVLF